MCKDVNIPQSTYYSISKKTNIVDPIIMDVIEIFNNSRKNYGTRKIKHQLEAKGIVAYRRRIGRIMRHNGLVSNYTVAQFKVHKQPVNQDPVPNELNREFNGRAPLEVAVSDLTYVRVGGKWNYVCLIVDLYNRELSDTASVQTKPQSWFMKPLPGSNTGWIKFQFSILTGEVSLKTM
ncbi:IS3 family transposase [Acetobacterium wieringae]|uniref:IS3 family transposase n=1 Tax=Acetobacterium wieringae TaxID=52694 RepID=UPI003B8A90AA